MKFGSVGFFKRLIVGAVLVLLVVSLTLSIVFGVLLARQKQRADWLETVNWAMLNSAELPEDLNTPEDLGQYLQNPPPGFSIAPSFGYQTAYPQLYVHRPVMSQPEEKVCYLTFDDGPSPVTLQVLKTLGDYGVKATFFVTGEASVQHEDILLATAQAGHTVAVHTYSHDYREVYASVDAFLADFNKMHERLTELLGYSNGIFRFAGGSVNVYNQYVYSDIVAEMTRRGFVFYDWNVSAQDAVSGGLSRQQIVDNVLNGAAGQERLVVLMHDSRDKANTAAALPAIIEGLQAQGYRFEALAPDVPPITYFYEE